MKYLRIFTLVMYLAGMLAGLHHPTGEGGIAYAQGTNWGYLASDVDGDGLPNSIETGGWCNQAGCYPSTDPFDPDTDNDGLNDGEEKLFDSNPINSNSPGIYVVYEDAFLTREYYPWQPYGHKMIARADTFSPPRPDDIDIKDNHGTDLDAIVVRRGTTFYLGGPLQAQLQVTKTKSGLDDLSYSQNPYTGQWTITTPPPPDGTVGHYILSLGGETMDLYVIFELPQPTESNVADRFKLTQLGINKFLYDDDPTVRYDNVTTNLGDTQYPLDTRNYSPSDYPLTLTSCGDNGELSCPPYPFYRPKSSDHPGDLINQGKLYEYENQQYNRFVLEDHISEAINGKRDQKSAADALADTVDGDTIFLNPQVFYNTYKVLNPGSNPLQQCSNVAGLLTTYTRAAGIPARPLLTEWVNNSFDHATEIFLNSEWRVYRGYKGDEADPQTGIPKDCAPKCGSNKNVDRVEWGNKEYRPWHSGRNTPFGSSLILVPMEEWDGSGGWTYRWASWDLYNIWLKPNRFQTVMADYWSGTWGWTAEPTIHTYDWPGPAPEYTPPPPPPPPPLVPTTGADSAPLTSASSNDVLPEVQLGEVVNEYGLDSNGNGQYDQLVLEVEVTATQAGTYALRRQLSASRYEPNLPDLAATGSVLDEGTFIVDLREGSQIVTLAFNGKSISQKRSAGPYVLSNLWVSDNLEGGPTEFQNESIDNRHNSYTTAAYASTDFETGGALLSQNYSHHPVDSDGNGQPDGLVINTGLTIFAADNYQVIGDLYDGNNNYIGHATWNGSGSEVSLTFAEVLAIPGPYRLRNLELRRPSLKPADLGQTGIDYIHEAYTVAVIPELIAAAPASFDIYPAANGIGAFSAEATNVFNASVVNGNLKVDVDVNVTAPDNYQLEAWLADSNGNLVTWAKSSGVNLPIGLHTMSLTFKGSDILARGMPGPYQVVALKILKANSAYEVLDTVNVAFTTQAYTLNQFTSAVNPIFQDYVDNGNLWSADGAWSINSEVHQYMAASKVWSAKQADASLRLATPLNLSGKSAVSLKFLTSYRLSGATAAYVEVSTDGSNWSPLAVYSGQKSWSDPPEVLNLTPYAGQPALHLRFRLVAAGGSSNDGWALDDFIVAEQSDTDNDGIPDAVEGDGDTDGDGIPDYLDDDSDGDGIPDAVEGGGDTDGDGIPNFQDTDSDGDGIPDAVEGSNDQDGDGLPNFLDDDTDGDGIPDATEGNIDSDGDGTPDFKDTDSDNDTIPDAIEGNGDEDGDGTPNYKDFDSDGDGIPDAKEGSGDVDNDGKPNFLDLDSDGDTMLDSFEWVAAGLLPLCTNPGGLDSDGDEIPNCADNDADGDGLPNFLDTDSDADGKPDIVEKIGDLNNPADVDQDGILDYLDPDDAHQNFGVILRHLYLPAIVK